MLFMTLVRVGMAPRAAGLSPAECQAHWRTAHADAARSLPGLRAYVQNHAVLRDGEPLLPYPGFDVCAETEFDDLAAMDAAFASEQYQGAVVADELKLIDKARFTHALCERRVLRESYGRVKLMTFVRGTPSADADELLIVRHAFHEGRPPAPFDAVEIRWFADEDAALAQASSEHSGLIAEPNRVV
jgi:uncharacterized protein (TIGR02118 family)